MKIEQTANGDVTIIATDRELLDLDKLVRAARDVPEKTLITKSFADQSVHENSRDFDLNILKVRS